MINMAKQDTIERLERLVEQQMETTKDLADKLGEKNSNPYEQAIVDAIVEKAGTESREIIITDVKKQIEEYVEEQLTNLPVKIERSEEHTSELQSRFDLVCRLLLEKKNKKKN